MSKTPSSFTLRVTPPSVSGVTDLEAFITSNMTSGETKLYPTPSWTSSSNFCLYLSYADRGVWDATAKKIYWMTKQANGLAGGLYEFDADNDSWSELWEGWPSGDAQGVRTSTADDRAHPYSTWTIDNSGRFWWSGFEKNMRRWGGSATSGNWPLQWTTTGINHTQPLAIASMANLFPASEEGMLLLARGSFWKIKFDGTGLVKFFDVPSTLAGAASNMCFKWPSANAVVFSSGQMNAKDGTAYNHPDATGTCVLYKITAGASGGSPVVERLPDPPQTVGWHPSNKAGTRNDMIIPMGNALYIFENSTGPRIWRYLPGTDTTWTQVGTHGARNAPMNIVAMESLNAVAILQSSVMSGNSGSGTINGNLEMLIHKL